MTRADLIRALLDRWHELNDPRRGGNGSDPGLVLMPHEPSCRVLEAPERRCTCYRRSVDEIERLLRAMRDGDEEVRLARRQLVERYLRCEHRVRLVIRPSLDKHGRVRRVKGQAVHERIREVVTIYDSRVEQDVLDAGILWLAWNWKAPGPQLPADWRLVA